MTRLVFEATCPGCTKVIRAPSADERRARVLRHIRNCNAMRQAGVSGLPKELVQLEQKP